MVTIGERFRESVARHKGDRTRYFTRHEYAWDDEGNCIGERDNGSQLPFLPDHVLADAAIQSHSQFIGSIRNAIREHAKFAGEVLLEMKSRIPHGKWTDWLKGNFNASPETARVYMRIAKNWEQIANQEGATLEELRGLLAEPKDDDDDDPKQDEEPKNAKQRDDDPPKSDEEENADPPDEPGVVSVVVNKEQQEKLDRGVEKFGLQRPEEVFVKLLDDADL